MMSITGFYISLIIYLYHQYCGNTEMALNSFHLAVLLGISAILTRR